MDIPHFVHPFIFLLDGHLGCFYFLALRNILGMYKILCRHLFSILLSIDLGIGLLGQHGCSV
jgi:hypothetical protein